MNKPNAADHSAELTNLALASSNLGLTLRHLKDVDHGVIVGLYSDELRAVRGNLVAIQRRMARLLEDTNAP